VALRFALREMGCLAKNMRAEEAKEVLKLESEALRAKAAEEARALADEERAADAMAKVKKEAKATRNRSPQAGGRT
jgi:hypothetical protein